MEKLNMNRACLYCGKYTHSVICDDCRKAEFWEEAFYFTVLLGILGGLVIIIVTGVIFGMIR